MAKVLVTGGSGLIGTALTKALLAQGHRVSHLSRNRTVTPEAYWKEAVGGAPSGIPASVLTFAWDPLRGTIDRAALDGVDHIVHLSGASIVDGRWSAARLNILNESRAGAAHLLRRTVREEGIGLKSFISASGTGWYGAITDDRWHNEEEAAANDAIGQLTRRWEEAADSFCDLCRVVKLRTPMVLAKEGGALPRIAAPVRWSFALPFGSGRPWWPWVHIDDLVRTYARAITDEQMHGSYNVCAAEQPDQRSFMRTLAKVMHRPYVPIAVPSFALRLMLGEAADLLTKGCRVANERLRAGGSPFRYDELEGALRACL